MAIWRCALMVALTSALLGCSSMESSIEIDAPTERVWEVISQIEAYGDWNPFFVKGQGRLEAGREISLTMQPVGKSPMRFSPKVLEVVQGQRITWRGRLGIPGIFDGTHHLTVSRIDATHTRFEQEEDFSGILVPFAGFKPYRQGWDLMNAALKAKSENSR
jgi:hypothetical protein